MRTIILFQVVMDILVYEEKKVYLVFPVKQADMVSYYFISQFYKIIYFVLGFNGAPGTKGNAGMPGRPGMKGIPGESGK